jgi:hypothetical protein
VASASAEVYALNAAKAAATFMKSTLLFLAASAVYLRGLETFFGK